MIIIRVCIREAGKRIQRVQEAQNLHQHKNTEDFLNVVPPDESHNDVREQVSRFVEILACYVAMSDPSKQRKWFKGQHGYDLTTEVSSDDIDNGDHQNADNCVTFER